MIPVTKTFLPDINEYTRILSKAWESSWITNRGALVKELESLLIQHLGTDYLFLTTNGTIPLQLAIKALDLKGDIITTPFSYVATVSSIVWENCNPVFVDIHSDYLTIDETKIEQFITPNTTALLATHVFGNPCNVSAIETIAKKHGLKVIYDGAHCFGVKYEGISIFNYGDVSTCSFHATKLFHTGEGGAVFCKNKELFNKLFYHHNFGHDGPEKFHGLGINGKMSELQAAMGLAVLPGLNKIINRRKQIIEKYISELKETNVKFLKVRDNTEWNYSYFPVVFDDEETLLKVKAELNKNDIFPRRYFYPSLNTLPYVSIQTTPVAERISKSILCLPLYYELKDEEINRIVNILKEVI